MPAMIVAPQPPAVEAGARVLQQGGNAVDAACAMLAATATMWDVLHWGGETQALIWDPRAKKVVGINALGVAPTGATPEFFHARGDRAHGHRERIVADVAVVLNDDVEGNDVPVFEDAF